MVQPDHSAIGPWLNVFQYTYDGTAAPAVVGVRPGNVIASHLDDLRLADIRTAAALRAELIIITVVRIRVVRLEHHRRVNTLHLVLIPRSHHVGNTPGRVIPVSLAVTELPHLHLHVIRRQRTYLPRHRDHLPRLQSNVRRRVRVIPRANSRQSQQFQRPCIVNSHDVSLKRASAHGSNIPVIDARHAAFAIKIAALNSQRPYIVDSPFEFRKCTAIYVDSARVIDGRAFTSASKHAGINIQRGAIADNKRLGVIFININGGSGPAAVIYVQTPASNIDRRMNIGEIQCITIQIDRGVNTARDISFDTDNILKSDHLTFIPVIAERTTERDGITDLHDFFPFPRVTSAPRRRFPRADTVSTSLRRAHRRPDTVSTTQRLRFHASDAAKSHQRGHDHRHDTLSTKYSLQKHSIHIIKLLIVRFIINQRCKGTKNFRKYKRFSQFFSSSTEAFLCLRT